MIERFRDLMLFAAIGALVTIVVFAWFALTATAMTFADRWVPAASLPPAIQFHPVHKPWSAVPMFFCARYVSTSRCRIA